MSEENIKSVSRDEEFTVTLKSNPQNGYLWYYDGKVDGVTFLKEVKEPLSNYTGCKQHFYFLSNTTGSFLLPFIYKRSWERIPYNQTEVNVTVN
jgi:predicted secreted protein